MVQKNWSKRAGGPAKTFLRHQPPGVQRRIGKSEPRQTDNKQHTHAEGVWEAPLNWDGFGNVNIPSVIEYLKSQSLTFFFYAHSLEDCIQTHGFKCHLDSDDSQIFLDLLLSSNCELDISTGISPTCFRNWIDASSPLPPQSDSSFCVPHENKQ